MAHGVGAADDHAARRLAEDVGELGDRHRLGLDELGERLAGADRRELVGVADEHDVGLRADGASSVTSSSRLAIEVSSTISRSLVELVDGRALVGHPAERGVDGRGVQAARLGHPPSGAAGRGDEQHRRLLLGAAAQISRIVAVLPVPGPPVTIESRDANAARTAAACSGAGTRSSAGGARRLRLAGAAASSRTISARSRSSFAVSGR